jgi:DNA repair exonuclease SbcCD ATPase subunit
VVGDRPEVRRPAPVPAAPRSLAPEIQGHLRAAAAAETRIHEAIQRAGLPYVDVGREVDSLLVVMERSAQRAQLLHEALADTPVARIEARLNALASTDRHELASALEQQLEVQRRLQAQLDRFTDEMERIVVELETIRASLISVSASTDADNQQRLADRVRGLRDEMSAVATGMNAGYD